MNYDIFSFFYNLAHQSNFFDHVVIFIAVWFPYLVIFIAGVFLLMHHEVFKAENTFQVFLEKKKEILRAFFAGIVAWVLAYVLKFLFHTLRPFDLFPQVHPIFPENGFGFPSGHATFFMALAFSIFFFHKKAGYVFIFFALIIGIARVIGGVHFPSDILGGFILGSLVAYFLKNV
jgi:membrane-associated phospholipid phosphatase